MRLTKRGTVWHAIIYVDGRRTYRSTKCHDRQAAEAVARSYERDAADPDYATANKATMSDALRALIADRESQALGGKRSADTVEFYRRKAGHLVRLFETNERNEYVGFALSKLRAHHVDDFIAARRREGAAESTIQKELVTLRAALKIARRRRLWLGSIEEVMPSGFSADYKPRTRALSRAELQRLLGELTPDRAARVAFIVATSACLGETDNALRSDVSDDERQVLIRGTKRATRFRRVPIVSDDGRSLLKYAMEHAAGEGDQLFTPWSNIRRDLAEACERAKVAKCSPNDLRRTCATWLRAAGVPIEYIAPVMGHADTRMVERVYGRLSAAQLATRIGAVFGKKPEDCITFASDETQNATLTGPGERMDIDFRFISLRSGSRGVAKGA